MVHAYTFDTAGRLSADTATSLGGSNIVDDSVLRIGTTYDDLGRVQTVTSYSDTSGATPVNQVKYVYNSWGQVAREYQAHDGTVNTLTTPSIQYTYDAPRVSGEGQSEPVKYVRLSQVTYPNGREVNYDYSGAIDNVMSRLSAIFDDANDDGDIDTGEDVYASYKYLGAGRIVEENYEQADVKLTYLDSSDNVTGLDRFGRVVDQVWEDYSGTPTAIDRYTYTYDRASSRIARDNELHSALGEDYIYDNLDRLAEWKLNNVSQKTWSLDSQGNNLSAGTYNEANEETPTGMSGNLYDAVGNMTTLKSGDEATYDAWNRLVEVNDGEAIVESYEYDGAGRRIQVSSDFDGSTPDKIVDDYHSGQQTIESDVTIDGQRAGGYQTIWSPRYIDSLILRDTLNTAGTDIVAAERVFYLADANYNVTGLVKRDSGSGDWQVAERYTYTPYGEVQFRNADWTTAGSSANANTTLYTGRLLNLLTDLYYYRARYYDAVLERFVSRDPIGYKGGINLYRYVSDSPTNLTDPFGLRLVQCAYYDYTASEVPQEPVYRLIQVPDSWHGGDPCRIILGGGFLGSWHEVPLDSMYRPGFKICRRDIQGGNCCDDAVAIVGNCCGGAHTYLQYGAVDANGNPLPGTQGFGIGGGGSGTLPLPEQHFDPDTCSDLTKGNGVLQYGSGAGKSGLNATDAEIIDCISKVPMSQSYGMTTYNCKDWAEEAAAACGM